MLLCQPRKAAGLYKHKGKGGRELGIDAESTSATSTAAGHRRTRKIAFVTKLTGKPFGQKGRFRQ